MAREVAEIPAAAARFLDAVGGRPWREAAAAMRAADPALIVTVARGSSDHAATYLKYAVELLAGVPVASVGPSVASIYGRPLRLDGAACIGISQSGQSPDIVEMMRSARRGRGADRRDHQLRRLRRWRRPRAHCLPLQAGPEQSVAATKTFVTSVLAGLALLAEWQEDDDLRAAVAALPEAVRRGAGAGLVAACRTGWSRAQSLYRAGARARASPSPTRWR